MKSFVDHIFKTAEPRLEKCPQNSTRVILIPTAAGLLPAWLQKEARTSWLDVWTSIINTGLLLEIWESDRWHLLFFYFAEKTGVHAIEWASFWKQSAGLGSCNICHDRLRLQLRLCPRTSPINLPFWAFIVFRSALYGALLRIKQVELIDTKSKQTLPFPVITTILGLTWQRASENTPSYCMCTLYKYNTMSHLNVLEAAGAPLKHNHLHLMLVWPRHQSRSLILSRSDPNTHQSLFKCHQRCIYM